jgi:hypothetical protein
LNSVRSCTITVLNAWFFNLLTAHSFQDSDVFVSYACFSVIEQSSSDLDAFCSEIGEVHGGDSVRNLILFLSMRNTRFVKKLNFNDFV